MRLSPQAGWRSLAASAPQGRPRGRAGLPEGGGLDYAVISFLLLWIQAFLLLIPPSLFGTTYSKYQLQFVKLGEEDYKKKKACVRFGGED